MAAQQKLTRREQQIIEILYRNGEASARDVEEQLDDAPGNATIRKLLRLMEEKGLVTHRKEGQQFIYRPSQPPEQAGVQTMSHTVNTYMGGSIPRAFSALLNAAEDQLTADDVEEMQQMIEDYRKRTEGEES